ncbi:LysR family transcriptional regulator [Nonomuraea fuscirosea]|uniref:LysR family transcriptional regulator n=1 Tax=Nonomuraea fuscirosea TaxID=1291556 RepID=UPI002DDA4CC2|nr:LysR family transcriptional regulator [Nonomuraea fuscirosea]WSA58250.1 LysR family transcriptional regulator [Nonomuraea fuscirosea]
MEIFLTLAEELHFGRTAERLPLTHARVSQVIKKQERAIGSDLFYRTSRRVRLTPIGEQLGTISGRSTGNCTRACGEPASPSRVLRDGTADVLVAWLPVEEPDLIVGPVLFTDPRVLAVSVDHELATRPAASIEMLADFQHTDAPQVPDYWADGFVPPHTPRGHRIVRGPLVTHMEDLLSLVSLGEVVNALPAHSARYWNRPDITWLPFADFEPLSHGLLWRAESENAAIRALAQTVRDFGPLHL